MIIHTEPVRRPLVRPEQLRPAQLRRGQLRPAQLRRGQLRRGQRPEAPRATEPRQAQQWQPRVRRTAAWIGCACAALSFFGSLSGKARAGAKRDVPREHRALADAVLARDADRACELLAAHFEGTTRIMLGAEGMEPAGGAARR